MQIGRIELDGYHYKDEEMPKLFISLDWYTYEDFWFQTLANSKEKNAKRWKRFGVFINFCYYHVKLTIGLKRIGLTLRGRDMSHRYK